MNKSILIIVKNETALANYARMLKNNHYDDEMPYSREVKEMIEMFSQNNWRVYLGTLGNFDFEDEVLNSVFDTKSLEFIDLDIERLNNLISVIMMRNLGSVELNFKLIEKSLNFLIHNFKGKILNNAQAMLRGMTKNYLVELDKDTLKEFGISLIPTKIFPNTVSFEEIEANYPTNRENFLAKPTTGELSNSLTSLDKVTEEMLRWKEPKIGGWVIQPICNEIWNGEFQVSFLNKEPIYSQMKEYPKNESNIPNQKERIIQKYKPSEKEIQSLKQLICYVEKLYNIDIDICRIDYMKDSEGNIILLEFEMVNPGFFIGYMEQDDPDVKNINLSIFNYCEEYVNIN